MTYLRAFWKDQQGQDLVEYALIAALLALAAVATMPTLGTSINAVFTKITTTLDGATGS
jgi:pilus assembly protein Flp/PilA